MSSPLVSIALTTYNGERYLAQQMDSLLVQDYPNFEIVVSDDGSSDGTVALLERYAEQDARVRLLPRARERLGFNDNFARCFAACRGELISPCDQDDYWYPTKTRRLVEGLGDAVAIYCNSRYVDGVGRPLGVLMSDLYTMLHGTDQRVFMLRNTVSGHAMLFRRTLLSAAGATPESSYFDWWLAFVACKTGGLAYLEATLIDYRRHAQAVTSSAAPFAQRKLRKMRGHDQRLKAMATCPGAGQDFAKALEKHWQSWYEAWIAWSMFIFVFKHRKILFKYSKTSLETLREASIHLIGHRLKRALYPKLYLPLPGR